MSHVTVAEAKIQISALLDQVEQGEEVIIARAGRPFAKIVKFEAPVRQPGRMRGKIEIKDDFEAPLPAEIASAFRGDDAPDPEPGVSMPANLFVDEIRRMRDEHAAKYDYDLARICQAFREREAKMQKEVIYRAPRFLNDPDRGIAALEDQHAHSTA